MGVNIYVHDQEIKKKYLDEQVRELIKKYFIIKEKGI